MQMARQIALPGRGLSIPVITSDPEAAWVGETEQKPVSNPGLDTKTMRGYKLAVIVPFSNQFRRDAGALFDALIERLPGALGAKFDATKVRLTDVSKSFNCPLAYILRKKLRKVGISKGFKVVFSEELPDCDAIVAQDPEVESSCNSLFHQ